MMTRIEDYVLVPPPSETDITGEIIPVADIENRTPFLRQEDYYYIRELWNAYRNDSSLNRNNFLSSYNFRSLLSDILYYTNQWSNDTYINEHLHLRAGLGSYSFTGSLVDNNYETGLLNWMKSSNAIVSFDNPPVAPAVYEKLDAETIRHFYKFLAQDMFRQVQSNSVGKRAFNYTVNAKTFTYEYPKLDSSDNLYYIPMTGEVVESNGYIQVNGISTNNKQVGMHSLDRYNSSTGKEEYYNSVAFPSSTITADIVFNAPVVEAYAELGVNVYAGKYQGLALLRPMTGSGVNWRVEILKRSDYDLATSNLTVPALNEWVSTGAQTTYFNSIVRRIFARFATPYFALPSAWNWSPSLRENAEG